MAIQLNPLTNTFEWMPSSPCVYCGLTNASLDLYGSETTHGTSERRCCRIVESRCLDHFKQKLEQMRKAEASDWPSRARAGGDAGSVFLEQASWTLDGRTDHPSKPVAISAFDMLCLNMGCEGLERQRLYRHCLDAEGRLSCNDTSSMPFSSPNERPAYATILAEPKPMVLVHPSTWLLTDLADETPEEDSMGGMPVVRHNEMYGRPVAVTAIPRSTSSSTKNDRTGADVRSGKRPSVPSHRRNDSRRESGEEPTLMQTSEWISSPSGPSLGQDSFDRPEFRTPRNVPDLKCLSEADLEPEYARSEDEHPRCIHSVSVSPVQLRFGPVEAASCELLDYPHFARRTCSTGSTRPSEFSATAGECASSTSEDAYSIMLPIYEQSTCSSKSSDVGEQDKQDFPAVEDEERKYFPKPPVTGLGGWIDVRDKAPKGMQSPAIAPNAVLPDPEYGALIFNLMQWAAARASHMTSSSPPSRRAEGDTTSSGSSGTWIAALC